MRRYPAMCGRFTIATPERIGVRFGAEGDGSLKRPRYNAAPGQVLPIVTGDGKRRILPARWGFPGTPLIVNARAEDLSERPVFARLLDGGRCLVPATGFYEWDALKRPFYFTLKEEPLFAFAGLYDRGSFVIVTTDANVLVAQVHSRMPAVLGQEREAAWLAGDDPAGLFGPVPAETMTVAPVGSRVNDPANDDPSLIAPLAQTRWW
ncbi:SOS response-associated peptidase [Methanofollis ethanolicus]|uniref:SOS response-associated peptidase n=1 Tax=Methanofollis ethanolicus TaxID=488124 RepID=UPI0009F93BDF|nr:SOS response-associated peptidase [Methanofollis ethanolicus]